MIAYCFASGHIGFCRYRYELPAGTIEICHGRAALVKKEICATSRHGRGYDGSLFVPGVPEAKDQTAAGDALELHLLWLAQRNRKGFRVHITPHNPFLIMMEGVECMAGSVDDRIRRIGDFDMRDCLAALLVEGLQKAVRTAIERRMRDVPVGGPA